MNPKPRILIIEDELDMLDMLEVLLDAEGFDVVKAQDPLSGLRAVYQERPDAILLDVMMPKIDGFEVCRRVREMTDAPVVFLTGKATRTEDIVRGFSAGADDYVTKPFGHAELFGRLRACLRRAGNTVDKETKYLCPSSSFVLDCGRHELMIENQSIYLCPKEFQILELLVRHAGQVLSRETILAQVWGSDQPGEPDLIRQYIYRLRKKIETDLNSPRYIHSVRSEGYYFAIAHPP